MTGFEAYKLYVSLKQHFSIHNDYNFVKYNGKTRLNGSQSYDSRNDRYFFEALGDKQSKDLLQYFVANFAYHGSDEVWIGNLHSRESEDVYFKWKKRVQSLSDIFEEDLKEVKEFLTGRGLEFDRLFDVEDGEHPIIFRFVQQRLIEVESYIIMDKILNFSKRIGKNITDSLIFPTEQYRYDRYAEFLNLNTKHYSDIMKGVFCNATNE